MLIITASYRERNQQGMSYVLRDEYGNAGTLRLSPGGAALAAYDMNDQPVSAGIREAWRELAIAYERDREPCGGGLASTDDEARARDTLTRPEHALYAAVIRHKVLTGGGPHVWTTAHRTPQEALAELDRIAAGRMDNDREEFAGIAVGAPFDLLRGVLQASN